MTFVVLGLFVLVAVFFVIKERAPEPLMIIMLGFIAAMLTGLVIDFPVNWIMRDKVDVSYGLANLNDGRATEGSFFLGSGNIDSVPSFMYYVKNGDGYELRDWPAAYSLVVETSDNPHVVYTCGDYNSVPRPFRWGAEFMLETDNGIDCDHAFATFYVPENSVRNDYVLDAQ